MEPTENHYYSIAVGTGLGILFVGFLLLLGALKLRKNFSERIPVDENVETVKSSIENRNSYFSINSSSSGEDLGEF